MIEKIRDERIAKAQTLRKKGINPYPAKVKRTHTNKEIIGKYEDLEGKEVAVVGRIMSIRDIGKLIFIKIDDFYSSLQLFIKAEDINNKFDLKMFDIADFVQAEGKVMKTKTGEISVEVTNLTMLSKAIRPLPEKWKGIADLETRIRRRYLDMTINPEVREMFLKKAKFWSAVRKFLIEKGFVEVNTPILEHTTGGADARPFITHHNALDEDFYLRISLELPLKKIIGGGFDKVFEMGRVFRNEGMDDEHLQEFEYMEFYWGYENYRAGMNLVKEMYRFVAQETLGTMKFTNKGNEIDFGKEWEELDYVSVIEEKYGINVLKASEQEIKKVLVDNKVEYTGADNKERLTDALWKSIRKTIVGPVFLVNHPKFISPLAKSHDDNPEITERYQIILCGSELGNGYSELNDPIDQYNRFLEQQRLREGGDEEAQMIDIDFVEMLEYGMPPTTGFGMSERLFAMFMDLPIRQVTMFPIVKREVEKVTHDLYPDGVEFFEEKSVKSKKKQKNPAK